MFNLAQVPTIEQNISEIEGSLRVPYELLGKEFSKFSFAELLSLAKVFTYSCVKNQPTARCRSKMAEFAADFHITERHCSRLINRLIKAGMIEKVEDEDGKVIRSWYRYVGERAFNKGHIRVDLSNMQTKFKFKADNKDHAEPYERYLTLAELLVLSLIVTHCDNTKKKKERVFQGSYRSIGKLLKMSPATVSNAIFYLKKAELIFCNEEDKAVNGNGWNKYHANRRLLKRTQEEYQKEIEAAKKTADSSSMAQDGQARSIVYVSASVADANARTDRKRYYERLRAKADEIAEAQKARLEKDTVYSQALRNQKAAEIAGAKAWMAKNLREERNCKDKERYWRKKMAERMAQLGISELDLMPRYRCAVCSDTGWRNSDGLQCSCYPETL